MNINNMNSMLLDVLKELGNIGSGNAATALAKMIDKKVDMEVPKVKILEFKDVTEVLGGGDTPVSGIYFQMDGDVIGNILFVLDITSSKKLVEMIFKRAEIDDVLDEMGMSVLSEIGNILAASYVNSLSSLTGLSVKISVPSINIDMAGAILSVPAIQFSHLGDNVLFIETQFQENGEKVIGNLFLIPEMDSFDKILKSLGVM